MPDRIGYASGTTTGASEDITSALKAGTVLGSGSTLTIKKFQLTLDAGDNIYINDPDEVLAITVAEDAVGSGRYVYSIDYMEATIKEVIIETSGTAWIANFLYA